MSDLTARLEALQRLAELKGLTHGAETPGPDIAGFAKEAGLSAVRGLGMAGATVLERGFPPVGQPSTDPSNLGVRFRKYLDEKIPPQDGMFHRLIEGGGAGLAAAPRLMIPSILSGIGGSEGAEAAGAFLQGQDPRIQQAGKTLAGVAAGGATGAALGPRQAPGASAEAASRDKGILLNLGMNRIGPEVDVGQVANRASAGANQFEGQLSRAGTAAFRGELAGAPPIPARDVASIYTGLRNQAAAHPDPVVAAAYQDVANSLVDKSGARFITDPDILSAALKRFKQTSAAGSATASAAQKFSTSQEHSRIASQVEADIGNLYFPLARANQASADFRLQVADPLRESPMGRLADANPRVSDPTSVGRLTSAVSTSSPQSVADLMQLLGNQGVPREQIARALAQNKLQTGPEMPDRALFGGAGSPQEGQMAQVLASAGQNPAEVRLPLRAAESRGKMEKQAGDAMREYGTIDPAGGLRLRAMIRPGLLSRLQEAKVYDNQVTQLLRSASPQELQALQQLSTFDPKIRTALAAAGMFRPSMVDSNQTIGPLIQALTQKLGGQ